LGSSGAYTAPEDPQVSAHSELWTKWYSRSTEARVSTRRTRTVETLVSDPATSVVTPALVGVKTLGSSGAYTAPKDPQVSAHSEPWTKWYSRSTEARVSTRRTRAVETLGVPTFDPSGKWKSCNDRKGEERLLQMCQSALAKQV
jgi:hypothetical protein